MKNRYPVYVISKGRYNSNLTVKALEEIGQEYKLVIEPFEYRLYSKVVSKENIICTPFENLKKGSIPVRNFVFEHSIKEGFSKHWILDDNINGFLRLNRNQKNKVKTNAIFRAIEDFSDRYENVALSGMNYRFLAPEYWTKTPYRLNTRIYSCILVNNSISERWRGKYNEDTDLSIRVLKNGYCTVLFNAFLCNKTASMKMKGGNEEIYNETNNRFEFAESLRNQHPDVVKVVRRYNRWHHQVDYKGFSQGLIFKDDYVKKKGINNYGMKKIRV